MYIHVTSKLDLSLVEPDNFRQFKVVVDADRKSIAEVRKAFSAAGEMADHETCWVSQGWLMAHSGRSAAKDWLSGFAAMLDYAQKKGWIEPGTANIRAHVEWSADAGARP